MNNLEEFIKSNREEFDNKQPREKLWDRIESDLDQSNGYGWIWKAAAVLLLAVCSFLIWERNQFQSIGSSAVAEFQMDPAFLETEIYYTNVISEQRMLVEQFDLNDPELKEAFRRDLASLDTMYQELKIEYVETSNQAVLQALIDNLQLRMELLNQQVLILEKIKNDYRNETYQIDQI